MRTGVVQVQLTMTTLTLNLLAICNFHSVVTMSSTNLSKVVNHTNMKAKGFAIEEQSLIIGHHFETIEPLLTIHLTIGDL